jgi:hypothetical protein
MGTNVKDVYYCQFSRTDEISDRFYDRNLASRQMQPKYIGRPVSNRRTIMPVVDTVKKSSIVKGKFDEYNMKKDFHPGVGGPYNGYCNNVDVESRLFNRFMTLQKCVKNKYVPDTSSDLYNSIMAPQPEANPKFKYVQKVDKLFEFDPNSCNLGNETFHNHTRQEQKNVKI